jgi:hypothetical protein
MVLAFYKRAGFKMTLVCAEPKFKPTLGIMRDIHGFQPKYANVPAAERKNRDIEERVMARIHAECARRLNFFPAKDGCTGYYSPREILHHVKLDFDHQCK